jgi:chemotaxis family two-component system sensor kinase Cph1
MTQSTIGLPVTWDSQPYSVKRHGLTITNCDMEPVQTPGCVQSHGALLVLRLSDLSILQTSDNAQAILGTTAESLLGQPASHVIGLDGEVQLRSLLGSERTDQNPLYLLTLPAVHEGGLALDVTVQTTSGAVVLEFEATGRSDTTAPDYYALIKSTVARLQTAGSLMELCNVVAHEIRELTGQDRVMVYKFHADGHGEVVAESRRADLAPWLGLHYPAADIPAPAREVFTKTWIRPVSDVSGSLAELVPLVNPDSGLPLNMTYCALRGASTMYIEYLQNMNVAAALTLAIRKNETLWGLIACHHYDGPKHVSYQLRAACEFLAQVVTLQHQAAEAKEHAAYRLNIERVHQQLITTASENRNPACFMEGTLSLLNGIHAGGAALYFDGRWLRIGNTPTDAQLDDLKDWLIDTRLASGARPFYATDQLVTAYPDAAAFATVASGLMAFPISPGERSLLLWFRPETLQTVNWGGNPHDKPLVPGPHGLRLTPRRSFELFSESVRQRSLPWIPVEIDAAAGLRMALLDLLTGQQSNQADTRHPMTRSNEELDAFAYVASHDLKQPLLGIHQYANELLGDSDLKGEENRQKLDRMVRLTIRMDGLLESLLQFSRVGGASAAFQLVDLNSTIDEALEIVGFRTNDGNSIFLPRPLPPTQCNEVQCRQIFVNLLSNALKYSDRIQKRIEVGYIDPTEDHLRPGCPKGSENHTIFYVADNGIGIDVNDFKQVFQLFKRLHGQNDYGGGTGAGLTIVSKLAGQHGGKVWVASTPGQGATFFFTLEEEVSVA